MASAAPAQIKCGVTVCIPSGMDFTCGLVIVCLLLVEGFRPGARPLLLPGYLCSQALLLLPELRRELGSEVVRLEHLADLDLGFLAREGIRATFHPFDRLFLRLHLP